MIHDRMLPPVRTVSVVWSGRFAGEWQRAAVPVNATSAAFGDLVKFERHHAEIEVRVPVEVPTVVVDDVLEGRQRAVVRIYGPATSTLSKVGDLKRPSSSALSMKPAISWRRWEEARGY